MLWVPTDGRTAELHLIVRLQEAHLVIGRAHFLIEGFVNAIWHYTLGGI